MGREIRGAGFGRDRHTPEFGFEHDVENVRWAVRDMNVEYPVAIDSADGRVRYHQFGEGAYEESERVIQQLLSEGGVASVSRDLVSPHPSGAEAAQTCPTCGRWRTIWATRGRSTSRLPTVRPGTRVGAMWFRPGWSSIIRARFNGP